MSTSPVTEPFFILDLQWTQLAHDERYHKDVVILPLGERVKHMALHMAKYVGYLAEHEGDAARVERVLTDAFIITLATANTLNQDLGHDLGASADPAGDLAALGRLLIGSQPADAGSSPDLLRAFARHAGALAKSCESLDHMEAFPFRDAMRASNLALFRLVVAAAAERDLDLTHLYYARLRVVEERSIFDARLRAPAS